jgi:Tol biopolymer transport system component
MMVLGTSSLNLRQGPSLDSPIEDRLPLGTAVELLGPAEWDGERYWYRVQVQDSGRTGWASEVYLASWDTANTPILFTSDRGGSQDIYRILPDGSGLQQLTFSRGDAGDPSWSPDRSQFVFAYSEDGDSDLVITDATGVNRTWLTQDGARDIHPAWSPDGGRIAFVSDRDGDWEIYVYELVEMEWRQLTENDGWDSYPAWSPSGDRIVYTAQRDDNYDLYLFDLSTGLEQRLTTNPYTDAHPAWSPVRDQIVYMAMVDPGTGIPQREIAILDPYDPDQQWLVTDDPHDASVHGYPDWSPDGAWIVFGSVVGDNAEISLMPARGGPAYNLTQSDRSGDIVPVWTR